MCADLLTPVLFRYWGDCRPSPHPQLQNLEASVRSRDERHLTAGGGRDLIEAVLN
jgi:hypothetical protein